MSDIKSYTVWDKTTRIFHWVNAICVTLLLCIGTIILNANSLGASDEGKVLLKTIHVFVGYVLALNLFWRLVWAFIGNKHARWGAMLPMGSGYIASLREYVSEFFNGHPKKYLGHNPAGRIGVTLLLILLVTQAVTGLVLAGTDIFFPPFGSWIQEWIAAPGVDPSLIVPNARELYDEAAYEDMRAFRAPFIQVHVTNYYVIAVVALIHIVSVIVTEIREGGGLISAMFTGKKVISGTPADIDSDTDQN
ncbi:MAG: cytochrome b/b6 domain-containing protein [Gammaproteobacteria bacterium]|jgi:Ni/Fe-hydrogenase 1 B-type cytochrome subunit